ncbi:MAG: hypothetical protein C4K48_00555 [Candidatus Thorarchaeota archaeon]|nr:MAG: hypothetical protein C4K48_00555 [Candidatus Thorarchaeota archaeon]
MDRRKVEEIFDKYAEEYSSGPFAPARYDTSRLAMSFADDITWHFMLKYLPKDRSVRILDAGGGDGYWAEKLITLGYHDIVLSDLSQGMLEQAKKRFAKVKGAHDIAFVKSDIADMKEFQSSLFDYVFSQYDAVSYCLDPLSAMKELARVAKPQSYVIVSLDTKFRRVPELIEAGLVDEAEKLLTTNISYDFDWPQYNLTWEELAGCFEAGGLDVIEAAGAPVFMHQVKAETLQKLEKDAGTRQRLLKMELDHCTNRSLVNFAGHLQMVGRKRKSK